jgi:hypothetical protein
VLTRYIIVSEPGDIVHVSGRSTTGIADAPRFARLLIQHAGPKLSGYPTSATTTITVAQNVTPGLLLSEVICGLNLDWQVAPSKSEPRVIRESCIRESDHCRLERYAGHKWRIECSYEVDPLFVVLGWLGDKARRSLIPSDDSRLQKRGIAVNAPPRID